MAVVRIVVVMCTAGKASQLQSNSSLLMLAPFSLKSARECGVGPVLMVKGSAAVS